MYVILYPASRKVATSTTTVHLAVFSLKSGYRMSSFVSVLFSPYMYYFVKEILTTFHKHLVIYFS